MIPFPICDNQAGCTRNRENSCPKKDKSVSELWVSAGGGDHVDKEPSANTGDQCKQGGKKTLGRTELAKSGLRKHSYIKWHSAGTSQTSLKLRDNDPAEQQPEKYMGWESHKNPRPRHQAVDNSEYRHIDCNSQRIPTINKYGAHINSHNCTDLTDRSHPADLFKGEAHLTIKEHPECIDPFAHALQPDKHKDRKVETVCKRLLKKRSNSRPSRDRGDSRSFHWAVFSLPNR